MKKLLKLAFLILNDLDKTYLPPLYNGIRLALSLKSLLISMVANYSRRFCVPSILALGILATGYATYPLVMMTLLPDAPKASTDWVLKHRFSGPAPSENVLIVDIDERTLATLAPQHGRWPWSRDVLADGLQKIMDHGAKAVLFNVMLSDPDKANPDADAAMDATALMNPAVAFPLIRLNPKNDGQSQLRVDQIAGSALSATHPEGKTVAVILPMFSSMQGRLGVANQKPDADGIIRNYPLRWAEDSYTLPSLVQRSAELGGADLSMVPASISLNWRNKKDRYTRLSFSDLLDEQLKPDAVARFKGAYVVLSLSAPGLGQTKATAVASIEDDGEILATAMDDALHGTYLRMMPNFAVYAINLLTIWGLVWLSSKRLKSSVFNTSFAVLELVLLGITLLSASYSNYLIDLSDSMSLGLIVFSVIKLIQNLDDGWSRARPGCRHAPKSIGQHGQVLLLSFLDSNNVADAARVLQQAAERIVGLSNVVRVDDLFGGESFIKSACVRFKCLLVHGDEPQIAALQKLLAQPRWKLVDATQHPLEQLWDMENKSFAAELAPRVLECGARLLLEEWTNRSIQGNATHDDSHPSSRPAG